MVIAVIAIVAAILLPALSAAKSKSLQTACENNLEQLTTGWLMYAGDNDSKLVENIPFTGVFFGKTNVWALGDMTVASQCSDPLLLQQSELYPYTSSTPVYHCPADLSTTNGVPRVRSYSMNGWLGSRYMNTTGIEPGYRTYIKESEMVTKGTSLLWVFMDEHEASINDSFFNVTMDDSRPFQSLPSNRHRRGYNLSFADGHVEHYRLLNVYQVAASNSSSNSDWIALKQITTIPWGQ